MDDIGNNMKTTVTKVSVTFPDLTLRRLRVPEFEANLIMPEPCSFVSRKLPRCSIIRPTETQRIAMNVVNFLTAMRLFRRSIARILRLCAGWLLRDMACKLLPAQC
jgi:hypothetical protein